MAAGHVAEKMTKALKMVKALMPPKCDACPPDIATAEQVSALGALVIFSAFSFLLTGGAFLCLQQAFLSKRRAMEPR